MPQEDSTAQLRPGEVRFLAITTVVRSRYEIVRVLGNGGMGIVYLAKDLQMDGQLCAIKETHSPLSDPPTPHQLNALKGLKLEWDYMSTLKHPAIPRGFDFFTWEQRHYLVMEYIEGDSLATKLEAQRTAGARFPFEESKVISWAIQICEIFTYLHQQQPPIYYRDCKPENFILTATGQLRIIDFGIARRALEAPDQRYTALGTKGFAAPESYTGECDARTDIFSLGVMMHMLLTSINPEQIWSNMWSEHPPRRYRHSLSDRVCEIIMCCLEADRERRWTTAAELAEALKDGLISSPSGFLTTNQSNFLQTSNRSHLLAQDPVGGHQRDPRFDTDVVRPPHSVAPDVAWSYQTGDAIHAAPALAGETIICGSLDRQLYAFSLQGAVIGTFPARAPIFSDPVATRRAIYCCGEDGTIHALDLTLKRRFWSLKTRERICSSPAILDSLLIVGTDAHHVMAVPLDGGEPVWKIEVVGAIQGELATIGDLVVFGDAYGYVYAIDAQGKQRWCVGFPAGVVALPIAGLVRRGQVVIVGSEDRCVYALDIESGFIDWRRHVDGPIISSAAFDGRFAYVGAADGRIYCLDAQNRGEVQWTYNTRSQIGSDLVLRQGRLYFGCADGSVFCLHTQRVEALWRHQARGAVVTRPLLVDDLVMVTSKDGKLYALRDAPIAAGRQGGT